MISIIVSKVFNLIGNYGTSEPYSIDQISPQVLALIYDLVLPYPDAGEGCTLRNNHSRTEHGSGLERAILMYVAIVVDDGTEYERFPADPDVVIDMRGQDVCIILDHTVRPDCCVRTDQHPIPYRRILADHNRTHNHGRFRNIGSAADHHRIPDSWCVDSCAACDLIEFPFTCSPVHLVIADVSPSALHEKAIDLLSSIEQCRKDILSQ